MCGSFLLSSYLNFYWKWPGLSVFVTKAPTLHSWAGLQLLVYLVPITTVIFIVLRSPDRTLHDDSNMLSRFTQYLIRAVFWAVLIIGIVDMAISFLRVEGLLIKLVDPQFASELGRSKYRGTYVHFPILGISIVIAYFSRTLGFPWLALLIVAAEIQIVIARFIFSYEQAFMGDLVRFWYGALFLFASAYTLLQEGHVRVDVLYASFTERGKAWTNALGSVFLGMPLCWIILTTGMWGRANSISGPLLSFEVTQSGYGMYVKYLLAGFLLIFAVSMLIQFTSYLLRNAAVLLNEIEPNPKS
ncbi:MAG: hypothetical protein CBB68_04710 [Rhodospirillaceae bacterium TMED8]|nr:hypothetical protein [Magnetovibrio sp.]OUT51723.1 MAG: hypothetical protein CBB68_04710 [Rhodospirillaceae bacterium TMED8]